MNSTSMLTAIMVHDWQTKGYAISEWNNDDSEFFREIGLDPDQVNITTTTGINIVYSKKLRPYQENMIKMARTITKKGKNFLLFDVESSGLSPYNS